MIAAALIIINVSTIHLHIGVLRAFRPAFTLLLLGAAVAVFRPRLFDWKNLTEPWPSKAVLALLLIACASAAFGISLGASATFILDRYIRVLVLFWFVLLTIRSVQDLGILMWAQVISLGILLVLALTVLEPETTRQGLDRLSGLGRYDSNDLALVLLSALPMAILLFLHSQGFARVLIGVGIVGVPAIIALGGSRGGMVGLVAVAAALFFTLYRVPLIKRLTFVGVLAGGLIVAAPSGYWDQMATILTPTEDYNYTAAYGRKEIAKRGVGYMFRYPAFGVGIGNFGRADARLSDLAVQRAMEGQSVRWMAPHNTYVQVGAEMGLSGLAVWLALLFGGSIGLWRFRMRLPPSWERDTKERRLLRDVCLFLPVSFVGFGVTSFFLSHAYTPIFYLLVAMLVGTMVLVNRELTKDSGTSPGLSAGRVRKPHSPLHRATMKATARPFS